MRLSHQNGITWTVSLAVVRLFGVGQAPAFSKTDHGAIWNPPIVAVRLRRQVRIGSTSTSSEATSHVSSDVDRYGPAARLKRAGSYCPRTNLRRQRTPMFVSADGVNAAAFLETDLGDCLARLSRTPWRDDGQLEVAEGKVDLPPGSMEYIDDLTGKGHTTRTTSKEDRVSIWLKFEDQKQRLGPLNPKTATAAKP